MASFLCSKVDLESKKKAQDHGEFFRFGARHSTLCGAQFIPDRFIACGCLLCFRGSRSPHKTCPGYVLNYTMLVEKIATVVVSGFENQTVHSFVHPFARSCFFLFCFFHFFPFLALLFALLSSTRQAGEASRRWLFNGERWSVGVQAMVLPLQLA